ncbi:MAG: Ig domain-containing protein [Phycisphaerae bacterium]|nr:Ig domain-containing protein [Phycisphaerae bacterium]
MSVIHSYGAAVRSFAARGLIIGAVLTGAMSLAPVSEAQDHLVIGQGPTGGTPLKLFSASGLVGASGHGPTIPPGAIIPILRIPLISSYARPRFGGYGFSTSGANGLGFDYAAPPCPASPACDPDPTPHDLNLNYLDPPPANFSVSLKRLGYTAPAEFSIYNPFGSPRMVEDNDEYAFGDAFNGGHVHPLFLLRRPGLVRLDVQFTSDAWIDSDASSYYVTSVPGRAALVPLDMSGLFNADVVDSDGADAPTAFDSGGRMWVLNGNYGTSAGLPVGGLLAGFQLGGPGGAGLAGSNFNARLDNGALSMAGMLDLTLTGQADAYLSVEFLVGAAGALSTSDIVSVTFAYADNSTATVDIRKGSSSYLPYRPIEDWQQTATPRPWTAVGRNGDRSAGFSRSTGTAIDGAGGENFFLFRAATPVDSGKVLNRISFGDYTGSHRVAVFAMLGIRKAPLEIVTGSLPAAQEGEAYSFALSAEGTPPFKNWMATGLPGGLSMDPSTGVISGTPAAGTAPGSPYSVTISCDDSIHDFDASYPSESDSAVLSLSVLPPAAVAGDIDGDGDVDATDRNLFVNVLLGLETTPAYVERSDLDESGSPNGDDIGWFLGVYPGF